MKLFARVGLMFLSTIATAGVGEARAVVIYDGAVAKLATKRDRVRRMAQIRTARGPVDSSELGVALMYERVFVLDTEILQNYPEDWGDEEKRISMLLVSIIGCWNGPCR